MGRGKPAAEANSGSECSGLRSPQSRYNSACCGKIGIATSRSGARSGAASEDPSRAEGPREPPNPPSPRAKIDRFCVHSRVPSGELTCVSLQITPALPLSQISVNRVTARAPRGAGARPLRPPGGREAPAQLDVDAGKLHGRRLGGVKGGGHVAECW